MVDGMTEYVFGVGTPYQAPIDVLFAISKVSDPDDPYVPMCMSGWQHGAIVDIETGDPIYEFPKGFAAVWISLTERKVYEVDVDFSNPMIDSVTKMFQKGLKNRRGEVVPYSHFKASLYPGGVVRFHLLANDKIVSLDYSFPGKFTSEYDDAYLNSFGSNSSIRTIDDYCGIYYKSNPKGKNNIISQAEYVNKIGLPETIWDRYYTRYNYKIRFSFENPQSYLYFWSPKFSNSERFSCQSGVNDDVIIKRPATICSMNLWWQNSQYRYTSYFYFNEEEMLSLFEKAFADHPDQQGDLLVHVGKYNNTFELSLCLNGEVYQIKQTEIRAFRDLLSDLDGDSELIYKNYEENHKNEFKGL